MPHSSFEVSFTNGALQGSKCSLQFQFSAAGGFRIPSDQSTNLKERKMCCSGGAGTQVSGMQRSRLNNLNANMKFTFGRNMSVAEKRGVGYSSCW